MTDTPLWLCKNKHTGFEVKITDELAQVLKKYPEDYELKEIATND